MPRPSHLSNNPIVKKKIRPNKVLHFSNILYIYTKVVTLRTYILHKATLRLHGLFVGSDWLSQQQ
jgi:hypothetical protein